MAGNTGQFCCLMSDAFQEVTGLGSSTRTTGFLAIMRLGQTLQQSSVPYSKQRQNLMKKVAQLYTDYMGKKHVKTTLSVAPALGKALEAGSYEEMGNGTEGCSTWCAWAWP